MFQQNFTEKSRVHFPEELEIIKAQMDERGESMTDTGPLVKLKESMKKIKKEIKVCLGSPSLE